MHKNKLFIAAMLSFSFIVIPLKPARAVDGPLDAVALLATALSGITSGLSAYAWHQSDNSHFILNELASFEGQDSWVAWYMKEAGSIAITAGVAFLVLMAKFCTYTGIPSIDRAYGLPRR